MINAHFNIFSINTSLFTNCLEGVTEEQAIQKISPNTNSLKWLAAHVTWARYQISALMGNPPANNPFDGLFENFRPYEESDDLKSLVEIKQEWDKATSLLATSFSTIDADFWEMDSDISFPLQQDKSNASLMAILVQHECLHIGQMATLKKYTTGIPMKLIKP